MSDRFRALRGWNELASRPAAMVVGVACDPQDTAVLDELATNTCVLAFLVSADGEPALRDMTTWPELSWNAILSTERWRELSDYVVVASRRRLTGEKDDLSQEVLLRLWRRGEQREPVDNWFAYANRLVCNVTAEQRRRHARLRYDTDLCTTIAAADCVAADPIARDRLRSTPLRPRERQLVDLMCSGVGTVRALARASGRQPCRVRSTLRAIARRLTR
ncbi:MAG: hypothetical protein R3F56_03080 [Planctomycetota bacterium]